MIVTSQRRDKTPHTSAPPPPWCYSRVLCQVPKKGGRGGEVERLAVLDLFNNLLKHISLCCFSIWNTFFFFFKYDTGGMKCDVMRLSSGKNRDHSLAVCHLCCGVRAAVFRSQCLRVATTATLCRILRFEMFSVQKKKKMAPRQLRQTSAWSVFRARQKWERFSIPPQKLLTHILERFSLRRTTTLLLWLSFWFPRDICVQQKRALFPSGKCLRCR